MLCVDMKLLNLSNRDDNNKAVWSRAIKPNRNSCNMQALYPSIWILDVERVIGRKEGGSLQRQRI